MRRGALLILVSVLTACVTLQHDPVFEFASALAMHQQAGVLNNASTRLTGDTFAPQYQALLAAQPCTVQLREDMGDVFGRAIVIPDGECIIQINAQDTINTQFSTLLHEITHTFIWNDGLILNKVEHEVLAESTACLTAERVGLHSFRASAAYLSVVPMDVRETTLFRYRKQVMAWVETLTVWATPRFARTLSFQRA
jgi:hypothetical protein